MRVRKNRQPPALPPIGRSVREVAERRQVTVDVLRSRRLDSCSLLGSIPRTCARSSVRIIAAAPSRSPRLSADLVGYGRTRIYSPEGGGFPRGVPMPTREHDSWLSALGVDFDK